MAKIHISFHPNVVGITANADASTLRVLVQMPAELANVELEVWELDTWKDRAGVKRADAGTPKDKILASFKGDITKGCFVPTETAIPLLQPNENLIFPPAVGLAFGKSTKAIYKMVLSPGEESDQEGETWELGIVLQHNGKVAFKGATATLVKRSEVAYLYNTDPSDPKDTISQGVPTHKYYIRDLKKHLSMLGFYRAELPIQERVLSDHLPDAPPANASNDQQLKWLDDIARDLKKKIRFVCSGLTPSRAASIADMSDEWDAELTSAVRAFQLASIERWRIDTHTGLFVEVTAADRLDPAASGVSAETGANKVGPATKAQLLKWIGDGLSGDASGIRWRSPFVFSFHYAFGQYCRSLYRHDKVTYGDGTVKVFPAICHGYDFGTGRLMADPTDLRRFVCVTAVNWFLSHLFARGSNYSMSANAPIDHAVLGLPIKLPSGANTAPTPTYYNGAFIPAYLLPWIHDLDPEKQTLTKAFLKIVSPPDSDPTKDVAFSVTREVATVESDRSTAWVRYKTHGSPVFQILPLAGTWADLKNWTTTIAQTEYKAPPIGGGLVGEFKKTRLVFTSKVPDGHFLLVSYSAFCSPCQMPSNYADYTGNNAYCRCGLHKTYSQIALTTANLGTWNIASFHVKEANGEIHYDYSTLILHKVGANVFVLHGDGAHNYRTLLREVRGWYDLNGTSVSHRLGLYYTIYKLDEAKMDVQKLNPCFLWNPDLSNFSQGCKYDYQPPISP